jgi:hypothetical protein
MIKGKVGPLKKEDKLKIITDEHKRGHFGRDQIFKQLWTRDIWWKGIREDILEVIGSCESCLRFEIVQEGFHPFTPLVETWPMKKMSLDLIVNVPMSKEGYSIIMVYMCLATRYLWLKPLKNEDSGGSGEGIEVNPPLFWYTIDGEFR